MIKYKLLSSLEKVFKYKEPEAEEIQEIRLLKKQKFNFQIAFCSDKSEKIYVNTKNNYENISIYYIEDVPVGLASFPETDDYYLSKESGMYPDVLKPNANFIDVKAGDWNSVWIEIKSFNTEAGKYSFGLSLNDKLVEISYNILNLDLPDQKIIYTNWYHSDCLCDYYNIKPFSDEFWRINFNFIKTAHEHGLNCILTPLFTPPLDTAVGGERTTVQLVGVKVRGGKYLFDFRNLKKWIEMCRKIGIEYFEMSHLFTQWGAKHSPKIIAKDSKNREKKIFGWFTKTSSRKYEDFIKQFGKALNSFISDNNLENNVFFHISDEPQPKHIKVYRKRSELIMSVFGKFPIMDALSDFDFYKSGGVTIPVPSEDSIEDFVGKTEHLWTYYCCSQCRNFNPNRFIAMPSLRNRVLGLLAYKYNLEGFLQWGYNFYNTQYSLKHINPFEVTDAGGHFPSGDSFMVYPDKNGSAICSLRLKVFYDGFQDLAALKLLESKIGRDNVLDMIGNISFTDYPHNEQWLLSLMNNVYEELTHFC